MESEKLMPWIFADLEDLIDGTYETEVSANDYK